MSENGTRSSRVAGRPVGAGGRRLAEAFDVVSELPVLAEARRRLLHACERQAASRAELAEAIESDAALAIAVMRAANNGDGPRARAGAIAAAVESLRPAGVRRVATGLETYDLIEHPAASSLRYEAFRRHAVGVRHATDRIADVAHLDAAEELAVAALFHDIGRLVLGELYGPEQGPDVRGYAPDERARRERRELGIDHALVGAVLLRRWGLPDGIASAVERHHDPNAEGDAAAIRLADLLVHHCGGDPVAPEVLLAAAERLELDGERLRGLIFEFPYGSQTRRRPADPCPLSAREIDALRGLAEGKVYKQIAQELSVSVSTIRTHLHNVYRKIGAVDRAQAVLIASDRGWL